jgi:hypothetical protein
MESSGTSMSSIRRTRWLLVLASTSVLALVPAALGLVPARDSGIDAPTLLHRVVESERVAYSAFGVSEAGLKLPDVRGAGRLAALFGETTRMRVWYRDPFAWRVDEIHPVGERDVYKDDTGTWFWDSGNRQATRTGGLETVRFARPADLLPSELGRRLASYATPNEVTRLEPRRIAGIDAQGLRISPRDPDTTLAHADVWADPQSGLAVRVEVTARGMEDPIISSSFMDLEQSLPDTGLVHFAVPSDAETTYAQAPDFASAVDRYSPFVLPNTLAGETRRSEQRVGGATYGDGYSLIAALALPVRFLPQDRLSALPEVPGPWDSARLAQSPLLNAITVVDGEAAYVLGGTVSSERLIELARELARKGRPEVFS